MPKICPSAQPGMPEVRVLGVVNFDGPTPVVDYLDTILPATDTVLAMTAPLPPTEVFRLAATCAEHGCPHFDGADCQLATRIVRMLPLVTDRLPPCTIRKGCRWYAQEGRDACLRCPEVTTVSRDLSVEGRALSGLPVVEERVRVRATTT